MGLYVGRSPQHPRSVALVLNISTGHVSPQFHIKFDSWFDTIGQLYKETKPTPSLWQVKAGFVRQKEMVKSKSNPTRVMHSSDDRRSELGSEGGTLPSNQSPTPDTNREANDGTDDVGESAPSNGSNESTQGSKLLPRQSKPKPQTAKERRQERKRKPVQRLIEAMSAELMQQQPIPGEIFSMEAMFPDNDNTGHPIMAYKAKADPDTLYLHEAMRQPDWEKFAEAMDNEIQQQVSMGVYTLIHRDQVPEGATVLPAVWQLRRKRDIRTGEIKKYKARCNIDGSRMRHGEHYDQTYAPVAGWSSIRLLLALVLLNGWSTVQLDYVLAFPQAPVERELYMRLPKGFTVTGVHEPNMYVLRINRKQHLRAKTGRKSMVPVPN